MWNTVITDKGVDLIRNTLTGENITVTAIRSGSGKVALEKLKSVTDVSSRKQTGTIQGVTNTDDGLIKIGVLFTNIGLKTTYNMTQIGVYVKDKSGNEILFAIAQDDGKEVPAESTNTPWALSHNFYIKLSNSVNLVANINQDGYVTFETMQSAIKPLEQAIKDLQYIPVNILSFSCNILTAELGSKIRTLTFTWEIDGECKTLTLDGINITPTAKSYTLDLNLTASKQYTLTATDARNHANSKTLNIQFLNGVYYGVSTATNTIDSAFILKLQKKLQTSRTLTFETNSNAGQYIYYALPEGYGIPKFSVGGFDGGFEKVATISFTNASGYTEDYDVYRSENCDLGVQTVKVS